MNIGKMKERITLLRPIRSDNRIGEVVVNYQPFLEGVPAREESLSSRDVARYRQAAMKTQRVLEMRYQPQLETDWHVRIDGQDYHVEEVNHVKPRTTTIGVYRLN